MQKRIDGKLVIASHNKGKLVEIRDLLAPFGIEALLASDFGLPEPAETEDTFAGNARIKAHFAAKNTGLPALSDDSGMQVAALNGAPGVYTADWAETDSGRDFEMAMKRVWTECESISAPEPRNARFVCTLCFAWPDGSDVLFEGAVDGRLVWPMRGHKGFGFDPMFLPAGKTLTFGEMEPAEKHAISHRAIAFEKLVAGLLNG